MAEEKKNISQAFSDFSKKLSRFKASEKELKHSSENSKVSNLILQNELSRKEAVVSSFKRYEIPSSKEIEEDLQNLLNAYKLYCGFVELNKSCGDEKTFIKLQEIKSPLTKKASYCFGGQFVYLQCWFMFVQKIEDYVPVLNQKTLSSGESYFELNFVSGEEFEFSSGEKELVQIIQKYLSEK